MLRSFYKKSLDNLKKGNLELPERKPNVNSSKMADVENRFNLLDKLGSGTYGEVSKAQDRKSNEIRAIKKLTVKNSEEVGITIIREISMLFEMCHENIIKLHEMCKKDESSGDLSLYMVMELCKYDLGHVIYNLAPLTTAQKKCVMIQLLSGLKYMHSVSYMHRDLKPANILVSPSGIIKLADMGLSRRVSTDHNCQLQPLTTNVVTVWYRAPELLLGLSDYSCAVDVWSAACVFVELWTRLPLFQGNSELNQFELITHRCGSINSSTWPDADRLLAARGFNIINTSVGTDINTYLTRVGINNASAINLITSMLKYDTKVRFSANKAYNHRFFNENPTPLRRLQL